jgi:diaminopimelate decarboxylase
VLRLRPDFPSAASVAAGPDSRFGFLVDQLADSRASVASSSLKVIGCHIFAGSQVLSAPGVIEHLHGAFDLAQRACRILDLRPQFFNLGGGFGIPYGLCSEELDLDPVGVELHKLAAQAAPARLALELGRYLVAPAGWYMTRVVGYQTHRGRQAVVVDGGTHQRADLCGLCLRTHAAPPLVLDSDPTAGSLADCTAPTDVLGCLSLPADILAESCPLPELMPGQILAFANSGAYGLWASAVHFHGYAMPTEVAFDGNQMQLLRDSPGAWTILDGQRHLEQQGRQHEHHSAATLGARI